VEEKIACVSNALAITGLDKTLDPITIAAKVLCAAFLKSKTGFVAAFLASVNHTREDKQNVSIPYHQYCFDDSKRSFPQTTFQQKPTLPGENASAEKRLTRARKIVAYFIVDCAIWL
jgi:hypothetical protein